MINLANLDATTLDSLMMKIAKEPVFYRKQEECLLLLKLKLEKMPTGFFDLLQMAPDIIQDSPLLQNKTYSYESTCARRIVEVGGDGSLSAIVMSLGYFPLMIANTVGFARGEYGLLKVGASVFSNWVWGLDSASVIGTQLMVIPEEALNLWPEETAIKRLQEDLISLFLHIKTTLVPFGVIVIKKQLQNDDESVKSEDSVSCREGEGIEWYLEQTVDMEAVSRGAGLVLSRSYGSVMQGLGLNRLSGYLRLDWRPVEVTMARRPTSNMPASDDFLASLDVTSLKQSFSAILDQTPQKGVPLSLRLAHVKRGRLISSMNISQPLEVPCQESLPLLLDSSGTQPSNSEQTESVMPEQTCSPESEEVQTGSSTELCNLPTIQGDGLIQPPLIVENGF